MTNNISLSIIIVNWNAGQQLRDCILSIQKFGAPYVMQTIVVDNGSTDGSENAIKDIPGVTLMLAGENIGFGKACNLGAQHAQSDYLLFLNPDAALYKDTLATTLAFMERSENAKVGICGVRLVNENGHIARSCARFPTALGFVAMTMGLDRIVPKLGHIMSEWDHASTRQVSHVIGAFFLVRRNVFEVLQGFDEAFFVYLEDLDFSYRANQLGWASVYFSEAQAYHAGGGTSRQVKAKRLFYSIRSRILYAFKHFNPASATAVLLATSFIEPVSRSMLAIGQHSWTSLKETWVAYGMLFRWLPVWILKGESR